MPFPTSNLSQENILRDVHDAGTQTLRTTATAIIAPGLEIDISAADGDNIAISDGVDTLGINADGSIDVNVLNPLEIELSAADGDNVAISDGTDTLAINNDGSLNALVTATDLDIRDLSHITDSVKLGDGVDLLAINSDGSLNINILNTNLDIRDLDFSTDSVDVSGSSVSVSNFPTDTAKEAKQDIGNASLSSIDGKLNSLGQKNMAGSVSVVFASDQSAISVDLNAFTSTPDSVQLVGSIDGLSAGTKYGFVNNLRSQILASHDRDQDITYADFGTKDQRITQIDYTSATFTGFIARKTITYTLVGTRYRRDSISWSII